MEGLDELYAVKAQTKRKKMLRKIVDSVPSGYVLTREEFDELFRNIDKYVKPERGTFIKGDYEYAEIGKHKWHKVNEFVLVSNTNEKVHVTNGMLSGEGQFIRGDKLSNVLRNDIWYQIKDWKDENEKPATCVITGLDLEPIDENGNMVPAQVDHVIPFVDLVKDFKKLHGEPSNIYQKDEVSYATDDIAYLQKWRIYHKQHAQLRWLSRDGNCNPSAYIKSKCML